ncbi:MAG: hypothetical protein ABEH59_09630 [Halobacteriales archaeon]
MAGCLAPRDSGDPSPSTRTETPAFDPDGQFNSVRIGDRTGEIIPHQVGIWNAAEAARSIQVAVIDAAAGETRYERTLQFPADSALNVELRAPTRYRLTVRVPDEALERSFTVARSFFDTCNDSYSQVSVRRNGRITVRTLTTELACQTTTA